MVTARLTSIYRILSMSWRLLAFHSKHPLVAEPIMIPLFNFYKSFVISKGCKSDSLRRSNLHGWRVLLIGQGVVRVTIRKNTVAKKSGLSCNNQHSEGLCVVRQRTYSPKAFVCCQGNYVQLQVSMTTKVCVICADRRPDIQLHDKLSKTSLSSSPTAPHSANQQLS